MILYQTENFGKNYEYRSNPHERWVMPPHIHEFSEIAFTRTGVTTVYVSGKRYEVPENHLIFILPNQIHEYTDETASTMRCAVFSNDHISYFFHRIRDTEPQNPVVDFSDTPELLEALAASDPSETMRLCGLLSLVCDRLLSSTPFVKRTASEHNVFHEVIRYVSENFRKEIRLSDLAKRLGYHEKYLSSTLHALTGMNFRTFLASYRISYAKELLRAGEKHPLRVSEIALLSGFSSINSFNRAFRRGTGMTPMQYRAGEDRA